MFANPIIKKSIDKYDLGFIFLIILCAVLVLSSFKHLIFYDGADEGYYLKYAALVSEKGPGIFPALFKSYISDEKNWVFPNPFRIAYILLSTLWLKIFGMTYFALSSFSLFSYLLMLGVSYYYSKKYFGEKFAVLFSVLLGFSPVNMAMARRALVDMPANLFLTASLWLFFDMLEDRRAFKYALFVVIYTAAILMKESAVLLAPVFTLYLIIRKYNMKRDTLQKDFLCASIYPAVITLIIYFIAAGSFANVLKVANIIILSPTTNKYAILYCSGSWFRYIVDFFLISPWVLLLAAGFIASYFSLKRRDDKMVYFLTVTVIYYLILNLFAKNIRYAMLLDLPIRLFAVSMILGVTEKIGGRYARLYAPLIIIAIAAYDYASFYELFVVDGIYDPVSALLMSARGIAPLR